MLRVERLSIRLGEFDLRNISLEVREGEYFVLLGPTGTGKTVLVECIAGLHRPKSGRIFLNGRDITDLPPEERGIGYVPQDYALFPNLTAFENIAFGLRVRKFPEAMVRRKVQELAEWLGITYLLHRLPLTLSGGEKQRVALARALAVEPKVLLLDEPLAAVDEQTRERLCRELKAIQRQTGATFVHVSHNFEETLAVADRIGVMHFTEGTGGKGRRGKFAGRAIVASRDARGNLLPTCQRVGGGICAGGKHLAGRGARANERLGASVAQRGCPLGATA
jgi:molybdate/tungstate transport system ATP-binding protein